MIHGIFYKKKPLDLPSSIINGTHPRLIIAPKHQSLISWSNNHCWLAQASKPSAKIENKQHLYIAYWGRLNNRQVLGEKLGIATKALAGYSDPQLILETYLQYAEGCPQHLYGNFCFVIYDTLEQTIFCIRDQMGSKPFYYYNDEQVFVFSSSFTLFHLLDFIPMRPNMDWASKFLLAHLSMDFYKTAYHQIFKLPQANYAIVTPTHFSRQRYFAFHTNKIKLKTSADYVELYRAALEEAIKNQVHTDGALGCELSGGLDSSTITAYAAKFTPSLSDFYTFGFACLTQEPHCISQINNHSNVLNTFIFNKRETTDQKRALNIIGAPIEHDCAYGHEVFYTVAEQHKVRTLLSGFGGDEFVTTLHADLYLYELLKNKKFITLYNKLPGNPLTRALRLGKFYYCAGSNHGKVNLRMKSAFAARWPDVIITDELIEAYAIKELYDALGEFDNGHSDLDAFTLNQRWVPFVTTRMENCTLMAASYGIDYRWPLLDTQLIQCFLSIPSSEKFHRGNGRYLHRQAVNHALPHNIVWQKTKYMGEPLRATVDVPVLNSDLHPDLVPLLNMRKLSMQLQQLPQKSKGERFLPFQNIYKINQLDNWLKHYFANGCHWANTPEDLS
jgi:asparagine synthase (glutamine-hydrolysing)